MHNAIKTFAGAFETTDLYKTGFADVLRQSGIYSAQTDRDLVQALAYVHGYADAARLASPYESLHWTVANYMGAVMGRLLVLVDSQATAPTVAHMCDCFHAELLRMVSK